MRAAHRKPITSIHATAIRMLARREYPRAELSERLVRRGADAAEVARVLDDLEQRGYLSDARFAQMLVTQKAGRYGKRAIAHALTQRRVASTAVDAALDSLDNVDELAEATVVWQRRFPDPPQDERDRARQIRFLMSRGYTVSIALKIVRRPGTPGSDTESA